MLEDHVCPFLRQWHIGLGFYGEQGIKGIHTKYNMQSQHFDHVKKQNERQGSKLETSWSHMRLDF